MASIILAFFLTVLGFLAVKTLNLPKTIYFVYFLLLLTTPWFIILIIGRPSLKPAAPNSIVCNQKSSNASCLASFEFLFFQTDSRKLYGIKDHGLFLPSFIPAFIVGIWITLNSKNRKYLLIPIALIVGLILTIILSKDGGLLSLLWPIVPISVLATLGFYKMLSLLLSKRTRLLIRSFVASNLGLLVYETARLYQIIIFHKPFF